MHTSILSIGGVGMKEVKISVCQFEVKENRSFEEFSQQVEAMLAEVPLDSDYVLFPELFTLGLVGVFDNAYNAGIKGLKQITEFREEVHHLFADLAKKRKQVIIAGSHLEEREGNIMNVTSLFDETGLVGRHEKTHIFPAEAGWDAKEGDTLEVFQAGPVTIGIANCYEVEIPEISRILALQGADIIFCPSYTFTEAGFWRVRHCAQARAIENQVYVVHCPTISKGSLLLPPGYGRASIISPCDMRWSGNGVVVEASDNTSTVITASVNIDHLYENRKIGAATTFKDRTRRDDLYKRYEPYSRQPAPSLTES
ncbi:nitrilase-related carbon-nitrogen hydrolase [Lysinibacillus odysseyi]|nr:nitrilase-related carbon-nitrogen hydrolase [Lysinibacillus odysseyi]